MSRVKRLSGLAGCWLSLTAFSDPGERLPYDLSGMSDDPAAPAALAQTPGDSETGQHRRLPYDIGGLFGDPAGVPIPAAAPPVPARSVRPLEIALTVDVGVVADSNINNATDLPVVLVDYGDGPVPVPLGAESRRRAGVGVSVGGSASADLRLGENAALAADAEAHVVDQQGGANDDASLLLAIGPELSWSRGGLASVQLIAFQRWYGGTTASVGGGLRGALQLPTGRGEAVRLLAETRFFQSDYGSEFDGSLVSASMSYEAVLGSGMSGAGGVYLRRYWLESAAFSSTELGVYGGVSRHFDRTFTGSFSFGLSRAEFDAPLAWLSPDARRDWRAYASLSARSRRPLLWVLYPSLAYTYGHTDSSIGFYDADRHVLRFGMGASF